MEPLKTVLKPIRRGLKVLTQGIKDMQKMLDSIEDSLSSEKTKKRAKTSMAEHLSPIDLGPKL